MPDTPAHRFVVPALLAVAAAALAAHTSPEARRPGLQVGRDAPQKVPQQPPIRVGANFVRVDAYPTKDGRPVMDLTADDFEVLEDGKPQKIDTFEHVIVRASLPQEMRAEPNSIEASKQLAANPRNRVFVVFLDAGQVTVESTWHIREPLIRLIDKILSPDDLVGIMTPRMAASDIVLARKTQVVASGLRDIWPWGVRGTLMRDERESLYDACYPPYPSEATGGESQVVKAMIARRRERMTLEALADLVRYLHGIREDRKAILTVTEGWLLYRPDASLTRLRQDPATGHTEPPPLPPPPHVDPWGRLTVRDVQPFPDSVTCDADRQQLANIDDWQYLRDLFGEANRANATFYTIDPRGLPVFDTPIGPEAPPPIDVDASMLRTRQDSMRMLAENTDGLAVMNSNDLDKGLRRISDDLSAYYLLGYYSTNTKFDGRFRTLTVRVKRPGVNVRARRGYRAATEEEITNARRAADAPVAPVTTTVTTAIGALSRIRPDAQFVVNAAAVPGANGTTVWVAGELPPSASPAPGATTSAGGTADIEVAGTGGSGSGRVTMTPGQRAFLTPVVLLGVQPGPIDVRVRLAQADRTARPLVDSVRIDLSAGSLQALLFRRGPITGNRVQPAADARFSRTERAHVEIAAPEGAKPGTGRLLDREGQPTAAPVTMGERVDEQSGQRWITGDVTLAALGPGDYAIELGVVAPSGGQKVITAIRVVK